MTLSKSLPSADFKDLWALPAHSERAHERAGSTRGWSPGPAGLPACLSAHPSATFLFLGETGCLPERSVSNSIDPAKLDVT